MKHILVTGGAGFIGSHVVDELLKKKYKVTVIDNLSNGDIKNLNKAINKIKFIKDDINNIKKYKKKILRIDYCIHLAALADIVPSITNPDKYFNSNVKGTFELLNFIKNYNLKKFIYIASSSCYGIVTKKKTSENSQIDLRYPYALTKKLGEDLAMHWFHIYKIPSISLRLFNVYGLRSRTSGTYGAVLGIFLKQKLSKKPLTIVGNGKQTRDFIYVSDVVSAIIKSMESKVVGEIFNIGSGKTYSINYLAKLIGGPKTFIPKRPGEPDSTHANIFKATKLLNWKPEIKLNQGIAIILENISNWKNAPLWNKNSIRIATKEWFKYLK